MSRPGQPTKYKPEYCGQLITHMEKGLSFEAFAGAVRVSLDTLYEWAKVHPEFSEAKKEGKALCRIWWESQGQAGLWNETSKIGNETLTRSINATIWIFNMKNRFGWRDKQEITAEVETKTQDSKLSEELLQHLLELKRLK